jgi:hypothetical protein
LASNSIFVVIVIQMCKTRANHLPTDLTFGAPHQPADNLPADKPTGQWIPLDGKRNSLLLKHNKFNMFSGFRQVLPWTLKSPP